MSHTLTVPSWPADTRRSPSGEKAILLTGALCPDTINAGGPRNLVEPQRELLGAAVRQPSQDTTEGFGSSGQKFVQNLLGIAARHLLQPFDAGRRKSSHWANA